ncbi:FecR domain-containing protein [Dongia sp.]|uniref:FecR family protein n=1 Tax=Dongia sp. TaxID=1977262 RepID=UPI0035ADA5BB
MKNLIAPGLGLAALISISAVAIASTEAVPIADVVDVVKSAFHTPPGGDEAPANIGDKLLANEAIRTESDSAIEMSFPDGATLRLEGDSDLILDSYVFDPSALKSAAAIGLNSGIMRYTTGEVSTDDTGVVFATPVATVGIRGTDIVVTVGANGATIVDVLSGSVSAKPKEHEQKVEAQEGQSVLIESPNQPPKVGEIGDFATAAGAPADAPAIDPDARKESTGRGSGTPDAKDSSAGDAAGGDSGGDSGSGSSGGDGGGNQDGGADGDGNSGHGDNGDKHDPDNPGGGKDKDGGNGGGGGKGGGKDR